MTIFLVTIDFPASKEEIIEQAKGREEIHWTKDKTIDLRSLLDQTGQDRFESMPELVEVIRPLRKYGRDVPPERLYKGFKPRTFNYRRCLLVKVPEKKNLYSYCGLQI
ncbi:hypothetical protein H6G06_25925 [Anabaena sphaerica FACHB-251]|uniref:Uncharacterized protein n=1 Tax=Anabaena sphaerica FACHB-251 TaxID=2692883 RepID=A0A926WLF7_9NOST|nr:hypothetical protein [Anabaena sphaerica]MBD2296821.1 hypothetical protein [Anabaena sphaerica FACHB-251]